MSQFLPDEILEIKKRYSDFEKNSKKSFSIDELITSGIRQKIQDRVADIQKTREETINNKTLLSELGIDEKGLDDVKKLQSVRKEMRDRREIYYVLTK